MSLIAMSVQLFAASFANDAATQWPQRIRKHFCDTRCRVHNIEVSHAGFLVTTTNAVTHNVSSKSLAPSNTELLGAYNAALVGLNAAIAECERPEESAWSKRPMVNKELTRALVPLASIRKRIADSTHPRRTIFLQEIYAPLSSAWIDLSSYLLRFDVLFADLKLTKEVLEEEVRWLESTNKTPP